jgi:hypothetical protein
VDYIPWAALHRTRLRDEAVPPAPSSASTSHRPRLRGTIRRREEQADTNNVHKTDWIGIHVSFHTATPPPRPRPAACAQFHSILSFVKKKRKKKKKFHSATSQRRPSFKRGVIWMNFGDRTWQLRMKMTLGFWMTTWTQSFQRGFFLTC